jgi:phosphoglycerate dehydrogenase-like enzyme
MADDRPLVAVTFRFDQLPPRAVIASNVGAYAEPMAEHALAMSLALLKRLPEGHAKLAAQLRAGARDPRRGDQAGRRQRPALRAGSR